MPDHDSSPLPPDPTNHENAKPVPEATPAEGPADELPDWEPPVPTPPPSVQIPTPSSEVFSFDPSGTADDSHDQRSMGIDFAELPDLGGLSGSGFPKAGDTPDPASEFDAPLDPASDLDTPIPPLPEDDEVELGGAVEDAAGSMVMRAGPPSAKSESVVLGGPPSGGDSSSSVVMRHEIPAAEPVSADDIEPLPGPVPLSPEYVEAAEAAAEADIGAPPPAPPAYTVDSGIGLGNLEAVAPVTPASDWLAEDPSGPAELAPAPAVAGIPEGSDIFGSGPPPAADAADPSDVLAATAFTPPPEGDEPPTPAGRTSDVALHLDQPPAGSTVPDLADEELPWAEEIPDPSDVLFTADEATGPLDSARLAGAADLTARAEDESILDQPSEPSVGDSSAIHLVESARSEPARPNDSEAGPRFDLTPIEEGPIRFPTSGAGLFTGKSAADIDLDRPGAAAAAGPGRETDEPSLAAAQSSIFSGPRPPAIGGPSETGASKVPLGRAEPDEDDSAVEFSDHPTTAGDSSIMGHPAGTAAGTGLSDLLARAKEPSPDLPTEQMPAAGFPAAAPSPLRGRSVPKTPAPKKPSDPSVEFDWVAGTGETETPAAVRAAPKRSSRPELRVGEAEAIRLQPAGGRGTGGWLGGSLIGLVVGVGASAGVYFSGALGDRGGLAGTQPQQQTQQPGGGADPARVAAGGGTVTVADARAALEAGDPARAAKVFETAPADTTEAKAARGQARFFSRVRALAQGGAPFAADDPGLKQAREDLEAVVNDAGAAKTPEGERAAVRAAVHLGLTHELAGDRAAARRVYQDAMKKFPNSAAVFQAALDRLDATDPAGGTMSFRLDPADAEQLAAAAAVLLVLTQAPPAAPEEAPPEAGPLFWKAVNAAAAGRYAEAIDHIGKAKAAHEKRARALAGRGLNPLSDPLEQIFPRCCDDLKAYWELRKALYEHPAIGAMVKKDGVNKSLDALIEAQKRALRIEGERDALQDQLKRAAEKLSTAEKELMAVKDAALKLDKDAKDSVAKLDKEVKTAREQVTDLTAKVVVAEEARKKSEAAIAGLAKELQVGKFLPEKYDDAAVLSATREVVIRASGPTVGALIPAGMAAVGGTGLTAGQLLDLSERVLKAETTARAATEKLAAETKRLQGQLDTETKKLRDQLATETKALKDQLETETRKLKGDHAAEVKKLTDTHAAELKKLNEGHAAEVKKATDLHAAEVKRLNDKYTTDTTKMADAHAAELKKLTGAPAEVADKLKAEHAAEVKKLTDKYTAEVKRLTDDRVAAVKRLEEDHARQVAALKAAVAQEHARAEALARQLSAAPGGPTTRPPVVSERRDSLEAARHLDAGMKAYRNSRYLDAEMALVKATAADPDNPLTWYFLGAARWQLGNSAQARADFEQGGERERHRRVSSRAIDEALTPIQGPARDALTAIRP